LSNKNITLYGAQTEVWDAMYSTDKNVIAVLPVGSGKSYLACLLLPIAATTPAMHKNRDILYVAPTYPMLERIIWGPLKRACIEDWGLQDEKDINNSKKIITFSSGIKIHCVSAESGLKGINAGLIMADEAAEFSEEALQELSNRIRPVPGQADSQGRMILISTPEGKNAFHSIYEVAILNPDRWVAIHKNYKQMRVQSKKWILEQQYLLSPLKFKKDLECDWGSVEDQFYYTWKKDYIRLDILDRNRELYSFHDFNKKCMTAIVAQVIGDMRTKSGKIEVLKSYAVQDCSTEQLAQIIRTDFPKRKINSIMDVSGSQLNRDTTSAFGITDRTILESYGFRIINNAKSNPLISDSDNSSNAFIAQGRLSIPYSEQQLIDAIETYHYEDGTRKALVKYKESKFMHIDGLGDCLRYGIHYLFPMQHDDQSSEPMYIDSDNRNYKMPGQQYIDNYAYDTKTGLPTAQSIVEDMMRVAQPDDEYWT
jgi:hypothetical protein